MKLFYARELTTYPVGSRRIRLLAVAVLATMIVSYEGAMAPVLPLILTDLHMSLTTYGTLGAMSAIVGAVAALVGGRLTDRIGRVKLLVPGLFLVALCCLGMVFVNSIPALFAIRAILSLLEGGIALTTVSLIRDFSPRTGRATAFGFWTWGPVGASFVAATVASVTLPLFDDNWRSQFVIQGVVAIVFGLLTAFTIAELSPGLRAQIVRDAAQARAKGRIRETDRRLGRWRDIARHPRYWASVVGIMFWLTFYLTVAGYGQTLIVAEFHFSASRASAVMSGFWILNLASLVVAGLISDRFQVRKTVSLVGAVVASALMAYFVSLMGTDLGFWHLTVIGSLLGVFMGVTYAPWAASFSENIEDIDPTLQGTGWGLQGMAQRGYGLILTLLIPFLAQTYGWTTWLVVAVCVQLLYIPCLCFVAGPWRSPRAVPTVVPAAEIEPVADSAAAT